MFMFKSASARSGQSSWEDVRSALQLVSDEDASEHAVAS